MNIFSIVFTLVSFKLSGVPAQQAGAGRLRSLPSSPLDGDVEKRLPLSTEQPPGRRTERYACLIHTNKAAVDSCYSSVGRGQCKDRHGNDYGRANYDRTDTNDLSAFSAEHCAYMCAGKPDGNQNLVGFDFADSIKVCACRFTAGYITDGNTTPGRGNCPRDASNPTSRGTKPCKPHTGVGAIDGSGGDNRSHCYRNNYFRPTTPEPTAEPTAEPTPEPTPEPTVNPTSNPTLAPTNSLTPGPTASPTLHPVCYDMEFHNDHPGWSRPAGGLQLSYVVIGPGGDSFEICRDFCELVADNNRNIAYRGFEQTVSWGGTCFCRFDSEPTCPDKLKNCSSKAGPGSGKMAYGYGNASLKAYPNIACGYIMNE